MPLDTITTCSPLRCAVLRVDGSFRTVAREAAASGTVLFELEGRVVDRPTRYTVQIGVDQHVEAPEGASLLDHLDRFPWRFLDHSCAPNARIEGRRVIAVRAIEPGDAVTFDYCTTEFEMATPFDCACGAPACRGRVSGFRGLEAAQRAALDGQVAEHVLALARATR